MNKKHLRVIREIQDRIPKDLLLNLTKKQSQSPALKKVVENALTQPDTVVNPRQKRRLQALLDSGTLDRQVEVLDTTVEAQIDAYMKAEIDLAVKLGRLPKEAPVLESLKNKGHQYARRQEKRLRKEFLGEGDDVGDDPQNSAENESQHSARPSDGGLLLEPGGSTGQ